MKKCFKCKVEKPLTEFYKHKQMLDGHLNKCKECAKKDMSRREKNLRDYNPEWVEKEKERGREKYHRLNYKNKKINPEINKKSTKNYIEKFPEKRQAHIAVQHVPRLSGIHLHHWSYNIEHIKDVIELSIKNHNLIHRFLLYDEDTKMYRRKDTNKLLNTKRKHINFIKTLVDCSVS